MANKTYTVVYGPTWWECTIVIDHNEVVDLAIRDMVVFWVGWQGRLAENKGDYTKTFLQQLASRINYIQAEYDYNLTGVIEEFEKLEGWYKMDGSSGITIEAIDDFEFSDSQYEVMEVPEA